LNIAARTPKQLAGVTISRTGRLFINFPRWIDEPTPSVAEVAVDGSLVPYPNQAINSWDKTAGESAANHFVCVQSVVADEDDMLWILDPASPAFKMVVPGGAKLLKVNLATNSIERLYHFDGDAAPPQSYLNDVRVAHGFAFISDSGIGAIVVLNLSTGRVRRLLENHASTKAEPGVEPVIGGRPWKFADNTTPQVHSDGIAIDPAGKYVYYKALTGRTLYRVSIDALLDESLSPGSVGGSVEHVAVTQPSDGLEFDSRGNLYMTALEENAITVVRPDGRCEVFARSPEFLWPDTITISRDGDLLFTASQFHLMPAFNQNVDKRKPPYNVFRLKLS
jgi:sugar lactone lactonase YvrE